MKWKGLERYTRKAKPTGKVLGEGTFGKVIEMKLGPEMVAGKIFKANFSAQLQVKSFKVVGELTTMMELNHPNIVKCKGISILQSEPLPVILMEKLECNLHNYIQSPEGLKIQLEKKMFILLDTAQGLEYLHSHTPAIIHRDLTARNVLLDSHQRAKIADFGNSRIIELYPEVTPENFTSTPGTLDYMPPEAQGHGVTYGPSLDVFSFGHLMLFTIIQKTLKPLPPSYLNSTGKLCALSEVVRRQVFVEEAEKLLPKKSHPLIELTKQCLYNMAEWRPHTEELVKRLQEMISIGERNSLFHICS